MMKNIDISLWEPFELSSLFDIVKGTRLTKKQMKEGSINYVGASAYNNGITGLIGNSNHLHPGSTLTVCYNGSVGTTFYQPKPFWATDDVNVLYPKFKMNVYIGLFLVPIIQKEGQKYEYINKWQLKDMEHTEILLPVDNLGNPNWKYMNDYMEEISKLNKTRFKSLKDSLKQEKSVTDTLQWKEYEVGDLFDIVKPQVYHTKNVEESEDGIPYVVRSKFNNGVKYRVKKDNIDTSPAGVISFGSENPSFFYQSEEWCSGRDIYYIDTRGIDKWACKFLATCLQSLSYKYSYNYGLFPALLKKEVIKLPQDEYGNPDWNYMSLKMRSYQRKIAEKVKLLRLIK